MAISAALTRSLPESSVVEVELLERAQVLVVVINVLLEGRIAHAPDVLPVSAGQMSHGAPSVHLIAVASRHCHRADQRGQKDLPHGGGDVAVCCRLRIPSCGEKAGSLWEIASAVEKVVQVPRQKNSRKRHAGSLISYTSQAIAAGCNVAAAKMRLQGEWSAVGTSPAMLAIAGG